MPSAPRAASDDAPLVSPSWQQQVLADIGDFLIVNRLDPTPEHYELGYRCRVSPDPLLADDVRAEIGRVGSLTHEAAERILGRHPHGISATMLADHASQIGLQMAGLSQIVDQSERDASRFRDDLEASSIRAERDTLLRLAAEMVARTRAAEAQLRTAGAELTNLRATLVKAQREADTDVLTDLPNRRALRRTLEAAIADCHVNGQPLALIFCDIDHFKRINDLHGHDAGDRVLRYVARKLASSFADRGIVGRYGGEEFAVIIADCGIDAAHDAIDRCRIELASRQLFTVTDRREIGAITFSAGIAAMEAGDSAADLLARADDALYRGKAAGRNCVMRG